jgi:hypothetical protein
MVTLAVGQANIITHIGNGAMLGVFTPCPTRVLRLYLPIKTLIAIPSPILVLTLSFPIRASQRRLLLFFFLLKGKAAASNKYFNITCERPNSSALASKCARTRLFICGWI